MFYGLCTTQCVIQCTKYIQCVPRIELSNYSNLVWSTWYLLETLNNNGNGAGIFLAGFFFLGHTSKMISHFQLEIDESRWHHFF